MLENLIPFERIAHSGPWGVAALLAILAVGIVALTRGANWFVEGATQLAYRLGISKIIVGATVVSVGTTLPEAAVSVLSALQGDSGFALGNAVGSVICNTGLIFGLGCVVTRLPMDWFILNRHAWLKLGSGCLLVALASVSSWLYGTPQIRQWMGVMLLALLVGYLFVSLRWSRQHPRTTDTMPEMTSAVWVCWGMLAVGAVVIIVSAKCLIGSAVQICYLAGVPKSVVSATLVAFGTSLPELVTALTSIKKGHPEILLGNIIGANILNVLFVIGASAAVITLPVPNEFFYLHFPAMLVMLLLFRIAVSSSKHSFSRWWGLPLLVSYAAFVVAACVLGKRVF